MNLPTFSSALYEFCPAYGWHVARQTETSDRIMLVLPKQIQLHEPIKRDPCRSLQTAAKARNELRSCLWWVKWEPTSLPTVQYSKLQTPSGLFLLVWEQDQPGLYNPFRLLVAELTADFPKLGQRLSTTAKELVHLPALAFKPQGNNS